MGTLRKKGLIGNKQGPQGPQKLCSLKSFKIQNSPPTRHFHSCNHNKWLPYQILVDKPVNNVQISPQTTNV